MLDDTLCNELERHGISNVNNKQTDEMFLAIANRVMVTISLSQLNMPTAFGPTSKKIRTLLLNKSQMEAVQDANTKKILRGKDFVDIYLKIVFLFFL